jgi:pyridoxal phosphate enzyme (YggS family)
MSIADNLRRIRERIAKAAESCGRRADEITLVGVTKYVGARETAELVAAGCTDLGEARPQELWTKAAEVTWSGDGPLPHWHLIGHLQRNKVRRTLPLTQLIHSVDSLRLLNEIDAEAAAIARFEDNFSLPVRLLLEVNTSGEEAKQGLAPDDVESMLAAASQFPNVQICGLMTMAALEGGLEVAGKNFALLRELRDRLRPTDFTNVKLDELSMGMSGDFEVAIREGATIVRIGSILWEA